jgi:hypothetical protein
MKEKEVSKSKYGSRRKVKAIVRNMEHLVALGLRDYVDFDNRKGRLPRDIEWLLTWYLKLASRNPYFWCDEVSELKLKKVSKKVVALKAVAEIGPEDGTGKTVSCQIIGAITLSSTKKELKNYDIKIVGDGIDFHVTKGIKN